MYNLSIPKVAIVDYGMGNLFSVKLACEHVGLKANISSSRNEILSSDAVILPGVGAFGDAMESLRSLDLVLTLRESALSSKPFLGICLGMQLLMSESYEFGHHTGLDVIKGSVIRFDNPKDGSEKRLKVPHVGWSRIHKMKKKSINDMQNDMQIESLLSNIADNEFMYFVHSFHVKPQDSELILTTSTYGNINFCSSLSYKNIFACQFHPERSSIEGLKVYDNLRILILKKKAEEIAFGKVDI